jgi:hypothetical protein
MKLIKVTGIGWGLIYFVIGVVFSFTLGNNDFWSGAAVYFTLFLLPLPISIIAIWFPRISGIALIVCATVSIAVSAVDVISSGPAPDLAGLCKFAMFHVPHLVFALVYMKAGRALKNADSGDEGSSVGVAGCPRSRL